MLGGRGWDEWLPSGDACRQGIAVSVGLVNRGDRAPPSVVVLPVPHGDRAITDAHVDRCEQASAVADVQSVSGGQIAEGGLDWLECDVEEEERCLFLLQSPNHADLRAVVTDLIEFLDIQVGGDGGRRARPELAR